jgi:hypothetical protein
MQGGTGRDDKIWLKKAVVRRGGWRNPPEEGPKQALAKGSQRAFEPPPGSLVCGLAEAQPARIIGEGPHEDSGVLSNSRTSRVLRWPGGTCLGSVRRHDFFRGVGSR